MRTIYCTAVCYRPSRGNIVWRGDQSSSALSAPWINKYRSLLIIYDNTALWTPLRTLDGQRVESVIYPAAVWTRDRRCGVSQGDEFRWPRHPRAGGKARWITKISASTRVSWLPVRLTRGFSAEKRGASLFSLSARKRMLLNPRRLPAKKTGILVRVNWFINHSHERDANELIILTTQTNHS